MECQEWRRFDNDPTQAKSTWVGHPAITSWHVSLLGVVKPEGGIDPIIICPHDPAIPFQQARRRQSIDIVVDPAVVALELFGKGSNAPDRMTVNVFEKLPSLGSQERQEAFQAFERQMSLADPFAIL